MLLIGAPEEYPDMCIYNNIYVRICAYVYVLMMTHDLYVVVDLNSFICKWSFLAEKKQLLDIFRESGVNIFRRGLMFKSGPGSRVVILAAFVMDDLHMDLSMDNYITCS